MATSKVTSLAAVTATGAGLVGFLGLPMRTHSMQVFWSSNPTVVLVKLYGSLDGTHFGTTPIATFDSTSSALLSGDTVSVDNALASHIRADLITLTGGTSPAVTAIVASTDE